MIGTIRKHSKVLWWTIIPLTIISFVIFMSSGPTRGGGRAGGDFGKINGKPVTQPEYMQAYNEFKLFYLFHYGNWPDKKANVTEADIERETYIRLFLIQQANDLGIHANLDAAAMAANQMLRSLDRKGQTVSMSEFVTRVLQPQGLTATDFENFARHDVIIQELVQTIGSPGALVTPQEAAGIYEREHQELSSQIVFFAAKKYLSSVKVTPDALGNFYTNYQAEYRLPDRIQVNYVVFNITNFLEQSKAEWAKTNLSAQVDAIYLQYGAEAFADAKTPEAAKEKIRESLIRNRALNAARVPANEFASTVFNLTNGGVENLTIAAKQKGLTVKTTEPFAAESGPAEFVAPQGFAKTVLSLTPEEPFANPIVTEDGVYVIALAKQLPSVIPPFTEIKARVTQDYQQQQAVFLARAAGTNFSAKLATAMAAGKSFASVCVTESLQPQTLPPFSLTTRELPMLEGRAELNQVKQAAFTTTIGQASSFQDTGDGGFVLFVQSQLPVDKTIMNAELPQFTETLRRTRENEAFNEWLNAEAGRALRETPVARQRNGQSSP
ncbi:MAG: SurA N-terminal domain-containing protein [Limisphaerales bacterium]